MKRTRRAAIGATDLPLASLLGAQDHVLVSEGYRLEWESNVITSESGGAQFHLEWISSPERGSWLVVPIEPHSRRIVESLVRDLQRTLIYHEASCYATRGKREVGVVSYEIQLDGSRFPRPTGLEYLDLEQIGEARDVDVILTLILQMIGIQETAAVRRQCFPVYEVAARTEDPVDSGRGGAVVERRLNEVLTLLRRPQSRTTLTREGADSYVARIEGAEKWPVSV